MTYELWLGDCLEEMDRIEAGSVDMILADLPYGTTACKWDVVIPFEPLWKQYKRVIKKRGAIVLTASQPFTSMLVMSNLGWFKWEDVWNKKQSVGFLNAKIMPLRKHENILVFGKGRITYNPQMTKGKYRNKGIHSSQSDCYGKYNSYDNFNDDYYPTSIIEFHNANQAIKQHPTQKPVTLLEYFLKTYSNPGELVLDNTCGSGSTGEACLLTDRRFIGIEKDAGYFEIARNRLEQVTKRLTNQDLPLFAGVLDG